MTRCLSACAAAALLLVLAGPAGAEAGRYVLKDVEDGFIRLDTETGAVSHCRSQDGNWRCDLVADAEAALQEEIARLADENAALERRLAEAGEPEGPQSSGPRLELPGEEDFDRIFGVLEQFMRRFIDFARSLNEEPGRDA